MEKKSRKFSSFLISLVLIPTLTGCNWNSDGAHRVQVSSGVPEVTYKNRGIQFLDIATDIELTSQEYDALQYRFSAKSILVKPRSFGGLNILDINELYVLAPRIAVFP